MFYLKKYFLLASCIFCFMLCLKAQNPKQLMQKAWQQLTIDNDSMAIVLFNKALLVAKLNNDSLSIAEALLNLGICQYGNSQVVGLQFATRAENAYQNLAATHPTESLQGRSRCLQLISTIYARQKKWDESIALSKKALAGLHPHDSTGTVGLVYNLLGSAFSEKGQLDSAYYFHKKAVEELMAVRHFTYLPGAFSKLGMVEIQLGKTKESLSHLNNSYTLSNTTSNKQAMAAALIGLGNWYLKINHDKITAELYFSKSLAVAEQLSDKSFMLNSLQALIDLYKLENKLALVVKLQERLQKISSEVLNWEKQHQLKSLEVQFELNEKERELEIAKKQKNIAELTNYILWTIIAAIILIAISIILFLQNLNKKNQQLLIANGALLKANEEKKQLREQQLQNELEHRESQLTALTLQMIQKNELLVELKELLEKNKTTTSDFGINKLLNKGLSQDKEWEDFNRYFESINKNFYTRVKAAYTDISPNDLKMCALIKMNLSSKEMAAILNISPDSVKTARYRLRKKLNLNTEDNLTEFILNL